jgi:hypothetical protein
MFSRHLPPAPDPSHSVVFSGQTVREVFTGDRLFRVIISRDEMSTFRVYLYRWNTEDFHLGGSPFWHEITSRAIVVDGLARAYIMAEEELQIATSQYET